jgi:cytochrome b561
MASKAPYSALQISLHWSTALLIGANYVISDGMGEALDAHMNGEAVSGFIPTWHVWMGSVLLVLVLARIVVRLAMGGPAQDGMPTLADRAAEAGHWVLYALMLAVPVLGAVTWFAKFDGTGDLHVLVMNALMVVILGHAAMAIFHHYVLKDGLLKKMIPLR